MPCYHASATHLGETFTFTKGGYYEANENGTVQQRRAAGEFCGFETSQIPELAASKTPEAAVFAKVKNLAEGSANTSTDPVMISIYELNRRPDVDLTNTVTGDFTLIEEVRYRNPSDNPIPGELEQSITLPPRILNDIDLTYLPPGPHIISKWGAAVKTAIRDALQGGDYEAHLTTRTAVEPPSIDAYKPAYSTDST